MKLRPLQDRILVQRVEEETTTKGGIIIPDTAKEKPMEGRVVATGAGRKNDDGSRTPLAVKEGDRVVIKPNNTNIIRNSNTGFFKSRHAGNCTTVISCKNPVHFTF